MQTLSYRKSIDKIGQISIKQIRELFETFSSEEFRWLKECSDEEFAKEFSYYCRLKRFLEQWQADPEFRQQALAQPRQVINLYQLNIEPSDIIQLWNYQLCPETSEPKFVKLCQEFFHHAHHNQAVELSSQSSNPFYQAWRERQIARSASQMVQLIHQKLVHVPVSFELSKGCSVGCWFCSVSAPRLSDIFFYTPENAQLWRDVLRVLKDTLGVAAGAGFCYWATDPLDNPDYEQFLCDFHQIFGVFPQTTTAQPLKYPARMRSLLKLAWEKGCTLNRFSIISLKSLKEIYEEFSPEELAFVGLALQNKESGIIKANAGRMRAYNQQQAAKKEERFDDSLPSTNACVTGFLFNMVEGSVKLISPCPADERWPNGYRIFDEDKFSDAHELKFILDRMIETHMSLSVRKGDHAVIRFAARTGSSFSEHLRFRPDLKYEPLSDGFQVSTRFLTLRFRNDPYLKQLGDLIYKGNKTTEEITSLLNICGIPPVKVLKSLNLMFKQGIFAD